MNNLTTPQGRQEALPKREYLYRGYQRELKKWVFGDLIHTRNGGCFIFSYENNFEDRIEVDPETVGEYINRNCDKTGERIFEGMEVEFWESGSVYAAKRQRKRGIVKFADCSFYIESENGIKHYRWMDYHVEILNQPSGAKQ